MRVNQDSDIYTALDRRQQSVVKRIGVLGRRNADTPNCHQHRLLGRLDSILNQANTRPIERNRNAFIQRITVLAETRKVFRQTEKNRIAPSISPNQTIESQNRKKWGG
jgi:hypothetical protein